MCVVRRVCVVFGFKVIQPEILNFLLSVSEYRTAAGGSELDLYAADPSLAGRVEASWGSQDSVEPASFQADPLANGVLRQRHVATKKKRRKTKQKSKSAGKRRRNKSNRQKKLLLASNLEQKERLAQLVAHAQSRTQRQTSSSSSASNASSSGMDE